MLEILFNSPYTPLVIAFLRVCDVSIGTFRTIMVVQGRKMMAGLFGFFEVMIWVIAISNIFKHLDNNLNLVGYACGYAMGNILGIWLEQKVGMGYLQVNIFSRFAAHKIAEVLRNSNFGITMLPAEGLEGRLSVIISIVNRKNHKEVVAMIEEVDPSAFISIQSAVPYRGHIHGARK